MSVNAASQTKQSRFSGTYWFMSKDKKELDTLQASLKKQAVHNKLPMVSTIEDVPQIKTGMTPCLEVFTTAEAQKPWHQPVIRSPLRKVYWTLQRVSFPFVVLLAIANQMLKNPAGKMKRLLGLDKTLFSDERRYKQYLKEWQTPLWGKPQNAMQALKNGTFDLETGLERHGDKLFNPNLLHSNDQHIIGTFYSKYGNSQSKWPESAYAPFDVALAENKKNPMAYAIKQGLYKPATKNESPNELS
jgi:hypothetical protein